MATDDRTRDDLISELINLLAGPVSTGVKAVGQANQRRIEAMEHLDQVCTELRRLADVSRRMINLLDEIEGPLRAAAPQIGRLAQLVDGRPLLAAVERQNTAQHLSSPKFPYRCHGDLYGSCRHSPTGRPNI